MKIGVLALQGSFLDHLKCLKLLGIPGFEVKFPEQVAQANALILPGGESTTLSKLLESSGLRKEIKAFVGAGKPVWGSCAGAILLSKKAKGDLKPLGLLGAEAERNDYGRQVESFEAELDIPVLGKEKFHGVFIRAPRFKKLGKKVEVLARHEKDPVMFRQGNILATAFHPELTKDLRVHKYFTSFARP